MKTSVIAGALMLVSVPFLLSACQTTKDSPKLSDMKVEYDFEKRHGCSSVSPTFSVSNIPDGTKFLNFRMTDLDYTLFNHGGGTVAYNGSSTVPEGALKSYKGPCPPQKHRYEIVVEALNANKDIVLGRGKATREFCCR